MVTYTYHGDGSVTVSPSQGQTGGSGFGSEGTYSSDQAARSAVSSRTREGAKENEQLEAKRKALQSPTAQWASQEAYERAYMSYLRAGGSPHLQPAGVVLGSTQEERHAEAAAYQAKESIPPQQQIQSAQGSTLKNPFTGEMIYSERPDPFVGVQGISGKEWLAKTREGKVSQVIDEPYRTGYQRMDRPKTQERDYLADFGTFISDLDVDVSKALNLKGYLGSVYSGYRVSEQMQRRLVTEQFVGKPVIELPKQFIEIKKGTELFVVGAGKGFAEKPVSTFGNVVVAFGITKGMGALVSKAPVLAQGVGVGRVARHISVANIMGAGMVGLYGADVAIRTSRSQRPAMTLGEITSTEIIPFATGAYLGTQVKMGDVLPKTKTTKPQKIITDNEPVADLQKAYLKRTIETETWKDYESLMKVNRWGIIDKKYPTPEPTPVRQIRTIDMSKDLIRLKPDFSVPPPRKTYPSGDFSKLTDRLVTPGEELIPIPKARIPKTIKTTDKLITPGEESVPFPKAKLPTTSKQGKVTILKDLNKELRTKWKAENIKLGNMARKQGYFTTPNGQQVGTQQIQIQKQIPKVVSATKTIQGIRTVNLEKDLVGLTALAIPIFTRRKTKQMAVMPSRMVSITVPKIQQIPKTIFKPIQIQKFGQQYGSGYVVAQVPIMKPIEQTKQVEKTISRQVSKTMMGSPEILFPIIPKFNFPKFDDITRRRKTKGRKASAYTIKNPFATLKDLVGEF